MDKNLVALYVLVAVALVIGIIGAVFAMLAWLDTQEEEGTVVVTENHPIVLHHKHFGAGEVPVPHASHRYDVPTDIMQKDGHHMTFEFHGSNMGLGGMIEAYLYQPGGSTASEMVVQHPYLASLTDFIFKIHVTRVNVTTLRYTREDWYTGQTNGTDLDHRHADVPWDWTLPWYIDLVDAGAVPGAEVRMVRHVFNPYVFA